MVVMWPGLVFKCFVRVLDIFGVKIPNKTLTSRGVALDAFGGAKIKTTAAHFEEYIDAKSALSNFQIINVDDY